MDLTSEFELQLVLNQLNLILEFELQLVLILISISEQKPIHVEEFSFI